MKEKPIVAMAKYNSLILKAGIPINAPIAADTAPDNNITKKKGSWCTDDRIAVE
jgi:hypothetical protein